MNEPNQSDWSELYQAALAFLKAKPWEWMDSDDLLAVENPDNGETGYYSILGSGGEEFGLGIFMGDQGFNSYIGLITGEEEQEDIDEQKMAPMLSMLLVDRGMLQKRDMDMIRSLGLQFRGRNGWPFFRSQLPGYKSWFLEKEEAIFLRTVIVQALIVAGKVLNNKLDLEEKEAEGLIFTRYFRDGKWLEEWRKPPVSDGNKQDTMEAAEAVNEARLHLLRNAAGKLTGSWEVDIFMLPFLIGPASSKAYFPLCFLAVEKKLGLIVDSNITEPGLTFSEKQDEVIKMLEKAGQLPSDIWVKSDKIKLIIEPITRSLGIKLHVGKLSALEEARVSLCEHFSKPGR